MKVLIISTLFPPYGDGGAERSGQELAEALARAGNDVVVVALAPSGHRIEDEVSSVRVIRVRSRLAERLTGIRGRESRLRKLVRQVLESTVGMNSRQLRKAVRDFAPDVVHVNSLDGFGRSAWNAARRVPLTQSVRDYYLSCIRGTSFANGARCTSQCFECRVIRAPMIATSQRPSMFVGVTHAVLRRNRELGGIRSGDQGRVVKNQPVISVDGDTGRPARSAPVVGLIGRIADYKGTWVALDAFFRVKAKASFLIAGSGSEEDVRRVQQAVLDDARISYLGRVPASEFYQQVDIVLVPSQWDEAFGRVAFEAASAGKWVLVSALGGLPEAIDGYSRGRLVDEYADSDSWVNAIEAVAMLIDQPFAPLARPEQSVEQQFVEIFRRVRGDSSEGLVK